MDTGIMLLLKPEEDHTENPQDGKSLNHFGS
jgi:hypothetical protein